MWSREEKIMRIAISGKSGCGNTTVSRLVAEKLDIPWINYTFRMMAEQMGVSFERLRELAEQDDAYDKKLDAHQVELAMQGDCVLGSRLAIWLLDAADVKVYLDASARTRAQRIAKREGGSVELKLEETVDRDRKDSARYKRIYGIDTSDVSVADLVIDTEQKTPEDIAGEIIAYLRSR
jgi:cytidylate kinase